MQTTNTREVGRWTAAARRISDWFNTVATPPDPALRLYAPELRDYPTRVRR